MKIHELILILQKYDQKLDVVLWSEDIGYQPELEFLTLIKDKKIYYRADCDLSDLKLKNPTELECLILS